MEGIHMGGVKILHIAGVVFLLVASIVLIVASLQYVKSESRTIEVQGNGKVEVSPTIASFYFSVESRASTVEEAQQEVIQTNNTLYGYLNGLPYIKENDITTRGFTVNPDYQYVPETGERRLVGYRVSQSTDVIIDDISKAGEVVSFVSANGATFVNNLVFTVREDEMEEHLEEALAQAVEDAKEIAERESALVGIGLGDIVSYRKFNNYNPQPVFAQARSLQADFGESASFETGQTTITQQVTVTFRVK